MLGRKLGMRDPDMGVWAYQYDPNGNLTAQTDARGQTVQYLFDALSRPIETRDANANWTLEKRYYDEAGFGQSKGRRTRAEAYVANALDNSIATTYDGRGRVMLDRRSIGGESYDTRPIRFVRFVQVGNVINLTNLIHLTHLIKPYPPDQT
ncbi:MAG: RHS repeat domain-containing protein [Thermoflexales bacterium]